MAETGKQDKYRERRLEVLQGAARVFGRLGVHRASIADVAEELGMTPAALYYYVKSKDELFYEASQVAVEDLFRVIDRCGTDPALAPIDRLLHFFRAYAAFVCSDFGRCLALSSADDMPSPYHDGALANRRKIDGAVRLWMREAMAEGSIAQTDATMITNLLFGGFNAMARWWSPSGRHTPQQIADAIFAALHLPTRQASTPDALSRLS